nr:hypothetical protein HmN_000529800 [Hymenolepis microstoma]
MNFSERVDFAGFFYMPDFAKNPLLYLSTEMNIRRQFFYAWRNALSFLGHRSMFIRFPRSSRNGCYILNSMLTILKKLMRNKHRELRSMEAHMPVYMMDCCLLFPDLKELIMKVAQIVGSSICAIQLEADFWPTIITTFKPKNLMFQESDYYQRAVARSSVTYVTANEPPDFEVKFTGPNEVDCLASVGDLGNITLFLIRETFKRLILIEKSKDRQWQFNSEQIKWDISCIELMEYQERDTCTAIGKNIRLDCSRITGQLGGERCGGVDVGNISLNVIVTEIIPNITQIVEVSNIKNNGSINIGSTKWAGRPTTLSVTNTEIGRIRVSLERIRDVILPRNLALKNPFKDGESGDSDTTACRSPRDFCQ